MLPSWASAVSLPVPHGPGAAPPGDRRPDRVDHFSSPPGGAYGPLGNLVGAGPLDEVPGVFGSHRSGAGDVPVLKGSKVVLNIHADSSPRFASNMRLFETTGMGACLLTDGRKNLTELFEPGIEVAEYRGRRNASRG